MNFRSTWGTDSCISRTLPRNITIRLFPWGIKLRKLFLCWNWWYRLTIWGLEAVLMVKTSTASNGQLRQGIDFRARTSNTYPNSRHITLSFLYFLKLYYRFWSQRLHNSFKATHDCTKWFNCRYSWANLAYFTTSSDTWLMKSSFISSLTFSFSALLWDLRINTKWVSTIEHIKRDRCWVCFSNTVYSCCFCSWNGANGTSVKDSKNKKQRWNQRPSSRHQMTTKSTGKEFAKPALVRFANLKSEMHAFLRYQGTCSAKSASSSIL